MQPVLRIEVAEEEVILLGRVIDPWRDLKTIQ